MGFFLKILTKYLKYGILVLKKTKRGIFMRKLFNTPKEYKEWEKYCWSEYGIDLNEDHFVNVSIGINS